MTDTQVFDYSVIPGFPQTSVAGHHGELVFGYLSGVPAVCMRGRFHWYEGHAMDTVVMPVRALRCLGVKALVVTNAAGGINPDWNIGDVMCIMDHFATPLLAGNHPLRGPNDDALGPRFPPVSNAYCKNMQQAVMRAAKMHNFDFIRPAGCYAMVSGPSYESPTECVWLRSLGCDTVGMSTVPEIVAAHHCGMKVLGLSLITNKVVMPGDSTQAASHQEVLDNVLVRASQLQTLVKQIVVEMKADLDALPDLPEVDLAVQAPPLISESTGESIHRESAFRYAFSCAGRALSRIGLHCLVLE
jgi:purine-nucleoside phosphorylase